MSKEEQIQELVNKTQKELADKGKILEGGWQVYLITSGLADEGLEVQRREMRKAYFLGAQHLFATLIGILDPGAEPTEKDLKRIALVAKELEDFTDELTREIYTFKAT